MKYINKLLLLCLVCCFSFANTQSYEGSYEDFKVQSFAL